MTFNSTRRGFVRLSTMGLAALAIGCGSDDGGSALPTGATGVDGDGGVSASADVRVRVAHLSPDAPAVDVWLDGEVVLSDVPFGTFSDYLPIPAGDHRIQVTAAGDASAVVIDATVPFTSGAVVTVAATGLLGAGDLQPIVIPDETPTAGGARVRFVHTSPDAPAVDIAVAGGNVLFPGVGFRGTSEYAEVPAGDYDLEVRVAGTDTVALPVPGVGVSGSTAYSIYAIGLLGDGSLAALPVIDGQ